MHAAQDTFRPIGIGAACSSPFPLYTPLLPDELLATKLDNISAGSSLPYHSAAPLPHYTTG